MLLEFLLKAKNGGYGFGNFSDKSLEECKIISLHNHEKGKHAITPLDLRVFLSTYELEFKCH